MSVRTRNRIGAAGRRRGGYVLITAMLVLMMVTLMGLTQLRSTNTSFVASSGERDFRQSWACAESALNIGIDYVTGQGIKMPGCPDSVTNGECPSGCPAGQVCTRPRNLVAEMYGRGLMDPLDALGCQIGLPGAGDPPSAYLTRIVLDPLDVTSGANQSTQVTYRLRAESASKARPTLRVGVFATFYTDNFAKFAYFTDEETTPTGSVITFFSGDGLNGGAVHTNDWARGFNIDQAIFGGPVSQVCPGGQPNQGCQDSVSPPPGCSTNASCSNTVTSATFLGGYQRGVAQVPLPKKSDLEKTIAVAFDANSSRFQRADFPYNGAPEAEKEHAGFFGNTWIKFNYSGDLRYTYVLTVNNTNAYAFAAKFDKTPTGLTGAGARADGIGVVPICATYPACPAMPTVNGVAFPAPTAVGSPDFTGILLQYPATLNFLENSLIGSAVVDDTGNAWFVVANDRDTIVLGAQDVGGFGPGNVPSYNVGLRIVHSPVTIFNPHYNKTAEVAGDGSWGFNGGMPIAEAVNRVARAVNFGLPDTLAAWNGTLSTYFPLMACAKAWASGDSTTCAGAPDRRIDLVFGYRPDDFRSIAVNFDFTTPPNMQTPAYQYFAISPPGYTNLSATALTWAAEGQGAVAGVNFAQAPAAGVIGVSDMDNSVHGGSCPEVLTAASPVAQAVGGLANVPPDSRVAVTAGNCGYGASDVHVWGTVHGAWSVVTLRDIFITSNRAQLPVWDAQYQLSMADYERAFLREASGIANTTTTPYNARLWKEGCLPAADSISGPADPCDQSKNIYGVVYANNPDPDDTDFRSYSGHRYGEAVGAAGQAGCPSAAFPNFGALSNSNYSAFKDIQVNGASQVNACIQTVQDISWRDYRGCRGDVLGLFAWQNILNEDSGPQSGNSTTYSVGGLTHGPMWDIYVEAVMIALNTGWHTHRISGNNGASNYPQLETWYTRDDQYGNPFAHQVIDHSDYGVLTGFTVRQIGTGGTYRTLGGIIQKYRGIVRTGSGGTWRGYSKDYKYDRCLQVTGPPPYTPVIQIPQSRLDFGRMSRLQSIMSNEI